MPFTVPLRRETSASPPLRVSARVPRRRHRVLCSCRGTVSGIRKSSSPDGARRRGTGGNSNRPILAMARPTERPGLGPNMATIHATMGENEACSAARLRQGPMAVPATMPAPRAAGGANHSPAPCDVTKLIAQSHASKSSSPGAVVHARDGSIPRENLWLCHTDKAACRRARPCPLRVTAAARSISEEPGGDL